jgi:hypothetical protein
MFHQTARCNILILVVLSSAVLFGWSSTTSAGVWGHWPLNDGQGDEAIDTGPRGETGIIGNHDIGGLGVDDSVWFDDPDRGIVASFNGDADGAYVFAGYMPDVLTTEDDSDFTWAFWAR